MPSTGRALRGLRPFFYPDLSRKQLIVTLKETRTKITKLLFEQRTLALAGFTTESRAKFDTMQADIDGLEADAQRLEAVESRSSVYDSFERSPRPGIGGQTSGDETRSKINKAFRAYALRGWAGMAQEQRDLLTTSDASGGALIPQLFDGVLQEAKKFYGPVALRVRQKITENNGAPIKISITNDTANGMVLLATEGTSGPVETDPQFQSRLLGVDTVSAGLVKVSFNELEDSSFDLDAFIRGAFGVRYGRGLEKIVTTGTDSAGTELPNAAVGGLLGTAAVGTTTATLAGGIGWTDIVNAFGALDAAYLNPGTAWMFNTGTRSTLLGMKDGFGRPFWTPDPSGDGPFSKLLGYDVVLNQAMPNAGVANATPIAFGDLQSAYVLRTDGQPTVLRLQERFADTLEQGFLLFTRVGGASLIATGAPNALVTLKLAAN
jgi:HK97 family phage major capsid protein